jgi:tetraacyldisaccharide 4'-kinase
MTAEELMGSSFLLPAGYRREPFRSLRRANVLVVSKCRDLDQFEEAARGLRREYQVPIIGLRTVVAEIHRFGSEEEVVLNMLRGKKTVAFSGIADGSSFERTLNEIGLDILAHHRFEDHHWYTAGDMAKIGESFRIRGAEVLVTTEKDMVRLEDGFDSLRQLPFFSVGVRSEIIAGKKELIQFLKSIVKEKGS